jgi:hypothetical protein
MRIPNAAHESRHWRIRDIAPDFTLEDVWALPVHGSAEDFQTALEMMTSADPTDAESLPTRVLWGARDRLGSWFDLGRISAPIDSDSDDAAGKLTIPGTPDRARRDAPRLGRSGRGQLSMPDGRLRQAARSSRKGIHGVHQAVPVLDCLPSPHATDRTRLE